jgi:hypothetical protein
MSEEWRGTPEAVCGVCGTPIDLDDCGHLAEGVAEAPDGLPAPVLMAVCKPCENRPHSGSEPATKENAP